MESWFLLLDEPIFELILKHTNNEIKSRKAKAPYQRNTDAAELKAFFGLCYMCGLFRNSENKGPLNELWTLELGNAVFRGTMSVRRFEYLCDCLRLSDTLGKKLEIEAKLQQDLLIWQKFILNCRSYYSCSNHCSVHQQIWQTRDARCPTLLQNDSKAKQHGLNLLLLNDAKTLYLSNGGVISEAKPCSMELLNLVCDLRGSKRSLTFAADESNIEIAEILRQYNLNMLGNLPKGSSNVPQIPNESVIKTLYHNELVIHKQTDSNWLLSSGLGSNINALRLHKVTHTAGERFVQLTKAFSCRNAISEEAKPQYHLDLMLTILDYAALNAWILFRLSSNGDAGISQRDFNRQLGLYLTQQHLKRRLSQSSRLKLSQTLLICEILGEDTSKPLKKAANFENQNQFGFGLIPVQGAKLDSTIKLFTDRNNKRHKCAYCPSSKKCRIVTRCQQCIKPMCTKYLLNRCYECHGIYNGIPKLDATNTSINDEEEADEEENDKNSLVI